MNGSSKVLVLGVTIHGSWSWKCNLPLAVICVSSAV
jgi:hypothetical protein